MTAFNRIVVFIAALALLTGSVITLLVAFGANSPDSYGWFEFILQKAADASGGDLAAVIAVTIVVALISIVVLFVELALPRQPAPLLVGSSEEGITTINQDSVCILAEKTAATVQNVRDVHCSLSDKVGGLVISCQARVSLASNVPEVSAELQNKVKDTIEKLTGLPVAQVDIKTNYESSDVRRLTAVR